MRGIAAALKRQRLRKMYPLGVHISPVGVRGSAACVTLTNLKNGTYFEVINYTGYLANLPAALHRDALIAGFRAAGVKVEVGFLSTADRISMASRGEDIREKWEENVRWVKWPLARESSQPVRDRFRINPRTIPCGWGRRKEAGHDKVTRHH